MRIVIWMAVAMSFAPILSAQTGSGAPSATGSAVLPKDIDPQSFSRLPLVKRDDLDEDGKRIYDELAGGAGKTVTPTGPAAISLYSPKARDYEVAILVTAREFDQEYEWSGHEMGAHNAKVPQAVIDTIKYNKDVTGLSDRDTLLITFARTLFHQHKLDSDLYAKAVATFGKQGTLELATVIGDYAMAAVMLNATDQHLPPGRENLLTAK